MAESKFLKYQDPSGTGLIEVCEEVIEVAEVPCEDCKCIANGSALTPNWRTLESEESYLNEKTCMYEVVIETPYTTTIDESLLERDDLTAAEIEDAEKERFEEFAEDATLALLEGFNKDTGAAAVRAVQDVLQYTDYNLDARANSRLVLLYSAPYNIVCGIADVDNEEESEAESDAEEESAGTTTEVTYEVQDLKMKLIRIRKGLHLYGMYLKPWRFIEGGNLFVL